MSLTATEFRKKLYAVLQRVVAGDTVDIVYKGSAVRLTASGSSTKLSRAKRRNTLLCHPDAIVHGDPDLLKTMEAEWTKNWKNL